MWPLCGQQALKGSAKMFNFPILSPIFSLSTTKSYYWKVFLPICNNFLEKNYLDKPVFNNVTKLNHSSLINNTVTNKIKHFPQLLNLGLKCNWHYFRSCSTITTGLDIYLSNCIDDYICKGLLQVISLVTKNTWLNILLQINP